MKKTLLIIPLLFLFLSCNKDEDEDLGSCLLVHTYFGGIIGINCYDIYTKKECYDKDDDYYSAYYYTDRTCGELCDDPPFTNDVYSCDIK